MEHRNGVITIQIELNSGQSLASSSFQYWYKHPESRKRPWFEISGPAGSGKTWVVKHIIGDLGFNDNEVIFMAFVGKAALALRLSGVNGRTVHSVIYRIEVIHALDADGNKIYRGGNPVYKKIFVKVNDLPPDTKLIVIDEGGMIPEAMGVDILSFGIPVLVLGDKHQLPPVMGRPIFLTNPDVCLTEIMRQKKDSPIIYLSQLATNGIDIPFGSYGQGCRVIHRYELTDNDLDASDLIICGTNKMRDTINLYTRKNIFGITSNTIAIGDKLICRKNCWDILLNDTDIALTNGMVGYVTGVDRNTIKRSSFMQIDFKPEFTNEYFEGLPINPRYPFLDYADRKGINTMYDDNIVFEFGYCITCHLAQGSQANDVLIYDDMIGSTMSDYYKKWLYTAITRAKVKVTLVR